MKLKIAKLCVGIVCAALALASCSMERKLTHKFRGKTQEELLLSKGRPAEIETGEKHAKIYVYRKSTSLKAAPINTGAFQYDRFESPRAIKTEITRYIFNGAGVVDHVEYEVSYER